MGCILGELLKNGMPLFQGNTEIDQFRLICEMIGFPTKEEWPEFFTETSKELMKELEKFSVHRRNNLEIMFDKASRNCLDLLKKLLCWSPKVSPSSYHLSDASTSRKPSSIRTSTKTRKPASRTSCACSRSWNTLARSQLRPSLSGVPRTKRRRADPTAYNIVLLYKWT